MLDRETKRRIDTARDILVGKVPDPKSQVEQITIALMYKFMYDMDTEAEELGGDRRFFAGEFEKYGWKNLMSTRLGGHEVLNLYAEGIAKMNENVGIPLLFRDIFKNAYLPYRDPETLKSFLKVIDDFEYAHSERLGDAFEYLLSVLGSQGAAGQFRTPRHIIDFMVEVIDPRKDDNILDPACGTAGFLISSYKHILKHNSSNFSPEKDYKAFDKKNVDIAELSTGDSVRYTGDRLTPDERSRLVQSIKGYDISPDMVRLSLVNLYLHGFTDPHIIEYDTLYSDDRWNEFADVIMANPPFMSPKGGIDPHKRFSIQSKRSEVLFVDYISEHLSPNGRAAVIVPEGIIFQSGTAYKQLRKMLVEDYLFAVVSLPGGVFNPYSGVKTSILFMDKTLAKKINTILFVRIDNDGFGLGAQRMPIKKNDIPQAVGRIKDYLQLAINGGSFDMEKITNVLVVNKEKIAENGEWNLSGDRYKGVIKKSSHFESVELEKVCEVISGQSPEGKYYNDLGEGIPFYQGKTEFTDMYLGAPRVWTTQITRESIANDIIMSVRAPVGPVNIAIQKICIGRGLTAIRANGEKLDYRYLFYFLKESEADIKGNEGTAFSSINRKDIYKIRIPLPPLKVQQEIVAEIDGYQKIIDGARAVVDNYRSQIQIDPQWELVELGKVSNVTSSKRIFQHEYVSSGIPFYRTKEIVELSQNMPISLELYIAEEKYEEIKGKHGIPQKGDLLVSAVGTIGISWVVPDNRRFYFKDGNLLWINNLRNISPNFLKHVLDYMFSIHLDEYIFGAAYKALTIITLKRIKVPLPDLDTQKRIVAQIEKEQELINANKELITLFEQKIKDKIAGVWGD